MYVYVTFAEMHLPQRAREACRVAEADVGRAIWRGVAATHHPQLKPLPHRGRLQQPLPVEVREQRRHDVREPLRAAHRRDSRASPHRVAAHASGRRCALSPGRSSRAVHMRDSDKSLTRRAGVVVVVGAV